MVREENDPVVTMASVRDGTSNTAAYSEFVIEQWYGNAPATGTGQAPRSGLQLGLRHVDRRGPSSVPEPDGAERCRWRPRNAWRFLVLRMDRLLAVLTRIT